MEALWDKHRGKGRTQRMLQTAVAKMFAGCSVFVVVRQAQIKPCMDRLAFLAPTAETVNDQEIQQYGGSIRLIAPPVTGMKFFARQGELDGCGRNALVLVDHHVIEQDYGYLLNQWLLWCGPEFGVLP